MDLGLAILPEFTASEEDILAVHDKQLLERIKDLSLRGGFVDGDLKQRRER